MLAHDVCKDFGMTITSDPWLSPPASARAVWLVRIPVADIHELGSADPARITALGNKQLTPYVRGTECQRLWEYRSSQLMASPADGPWITRLIVDPVTGGTVGVAGFHGPPDENQMVEFGYRVQPSYSRQGFARAALEALLVVVHAHPGVRTIRATISPDNTASRSLVAQYGFVEVGEQWDDDDGLEIIFERDVRGA
jgi:ribosomal-protein-alanine N-acetyltransferase